MRYMGMQGVVFQSQGCFKGNGYLTGQGITGAVRTSSCMPDPVLFTFAHPSQPYSPHKYHTFNSWHVSATSLCPVRGVDRPTVWYLSRALPHRSMRIF
jgi:hypothetical protein